MFIVILGILDIWTALYLFLLYFDFSGYFVALLHSVYLFVKGILFWGDVFSVIDVIISGYILLAILGFHPLVLTLLASGYLLFKGTQSLK